MTLSPQDVKLIDDEKGYAGKINHVLGNCLTPLAPLHKKYMPPEFAGLELKKDEVEAVRATVSRMTEGLKRIRSLHPLHFIEV